MNLKELFSVLYFCSLGYVYSDDINDLDYEDIPTIEGFGGTIRIAEEDDVLVLNNNNFHHVVNTKDVILVDFYTPWCSHCEALAPQFAEAATILKEDSIPLGKVDVTEQKDLGAEFEIQGYPTLKLFKKGKVIEDFSGARSTTGLVEYMRNHADPNYVPPPPEVVDLTEENFEAFLEETKLSLVEFYSPECDPCKALAPEFEGAAAELKAFGIKLAKIDGTAERALVEKYNAANYPKLIVFRNDNGYDYKGGKTKPEIVSYMKEMAELPSTEVQTIVKAKNQLSKTELTVFCHFESSESGSFKEFIYAANHMRGEIPFLHTFDAEIGQKYNLKANVINIIFPDVYVSKYEKRRISLTKEDFNFADVVHWIRKNYVPLIGQRTMSNMNLKYVKRPLVVVYIDVNVPEQFVKETSYARNKILPLAHKFKDDLVFALCEEAEFKDELKELGLDDSGEEVNVAILGQGREKYQMEPVEDFDEVLESFVWKFKQGKLNPYLKSQNIPKKQDGPVRVIVANSFEKEVTKNDNDVLLEFYAPWCGHCRQLEPVYKKLAKYFDKLENSKVVIAKFDATANDLPPGFEIKGFPTMIFVRASDNEKINFEGERSFEALKKFVLDSQISSEFRDEL